MKWGFLCLMAILFNSCASVGGVYISSAYLSIDSPNYAKGFELRKNGETYIIEYAYSNIKTNVDQLTRATFGYARRFASLDQKNLRRLCNGDSLPTLIKQDLILEEVSSRKFDAGDHIYFNSIGCPDFPIFKIVDSGKIKKPARIGLIAASVAADAALLYAYPSIYASIVLGGAAIGVVAILLIAPSLH